MCDELFAVVTQRYQFAQGGISEENIPCAAIVGVGFREGRYPLPGGIGILGERRKSTNLL